MRDLSDNIGAVSTLSPAVQAATANGTGVDLLGFDSAALVVNTGAIGGAGLFVMSLEESDDNATFTVVADGDMVGELPDSLAASTVYRVGYIGTKRYVRGVISKTSGTSIAAGAVVVLGNPHSAPVA